MSSTTSEKKSLLAALDLFLCCPSLTFNSVRLSGSKASIFPAYDDVSSLRLYAALYFKTLGFFFTEGMTSFFRHWDENHGRDLGN